MRLIIDGYDLTGDYDEWTAFYRLISITEPEYLITILEHYDLENWM